MLCSSEDNGDKLCFSIFVKAIQLHNQAISVDNYKPVAQRGMLDIVF
tara:strand:+ start:110 stop:250 length:141 start_codon:yes stop_codon:yes gene_type:complete